jgi:hypothetical protein
MSEYVKDTISKGERAGDAASEILTPPGDTGSSAELRHGEWIAEAREGLKLGMFSNARFALLLVFMVLYVGSMFLFENMDVLTGPLYAAKIIVSSMFAVSLGFVLSVWWTASARFDQRIRDAERIDMEYRELLMSFSDSLFDIVNALNTLTAKPPKPFIVATEFLLGEYVHLLQSQLQRYGDYVAGLGFDATAFLDEKRRIFEGIRERASLSIQGMPVELESLFIEGLNLDIERFEDASAQRLARNRSKLQELGTEGAPSAG